MGERQMKAAKAQQAAMDEYVRSTAGGGSAADELSKLADLHSQGKLDDAEYAAAKAKVVS